MIKKVQQVLFGSLLGDGHVTNEIKARFSEVHCLRQKKYLLWKKFILEKEFSFGKTTYNKEKKMIRIRSCPDERLTLIRTLFYPNNRRSLNNNILRQLNLLALAVWYCDDGTYNYQHYYSRIFSYNFNYQEHLLLQKYFKRNWEINCEVPIDSRNKCYLHFNAENTRKFLRLIKPIFKRYHLPICMWYKLGHLYSEGNKQFIEEALEKKRISHSLWYKCPEARARKREYYLAHRERILEQRKIHQQKPEAKERRKKYEKKYSKIYYQKNRDRINEYKRAWRKRRRLLSQSYDIGVINNQDWWKRIKSGEYLKYYKIQYGKK